MPDFVSFPIFGFILVIKLRNLDFESNWNSLIFVNKKWCQIWICFVKQYLIWFKLHGLYSILANSWEIQILDFIEIVKYFQLGNLLSFQKLPRFFFALFVFFGIIIEIVWIWMAFNDFQIYWNTSLKLLYLKEVRNFVFIRNDFFGYRPIRHWPGISNLFSKK